MLELNDDERQELIRLRKENERLEYVLEGAGLGSWDWRMDTNSVTFDRRWCQMIGHDSREVPQEFSQEFSSWDSRLHPDDRSQAYQDIQEHIQGKVPYYENIHRLRHKNGSWVWILVRGLIHEWDEKGNPLRFAGTHLDISKFMEAKMLSKSIQEMANIGGWELDVATQKTKWTEQTYHIHKIKKGTETNRIQGITFYAPHERERINNYVIECMKGIPFRDTFEFVDAEGNHKWVEAMGEPVLDANGKVYKVRGTFQDVTDRKKVEISLKSKTEKLAKSQKILTQILDLLPMMVFAKNLRNEMKYTLWNRAAENIVGVSATEMLGKTDFDLFENDQAEGFRKTDLETIALNDILVIPEEMVQTKNGAVILRTRKTVIKDEYGKPYLLLGISEDITKEKKYLEVLNETKERLSKLIELIPAGVFQTDRYGNCVFVNESWIELSGQKFESAQGLGWLNAIHPDDKERVYEEWERTVIEGRPFDLVYRFLKLDGFTTFVHGRSCAIHDDSGKVIGYLGSVQDMTLQKRVQDKLEKTSKELDQFFNLSLDLLCIADSKGLLRKINPAFSLLLGFSTEELLSVPAIDFVHPEDREETKRVFRRILRGHPVMNYENRCRCADGEYKILSWTASMDKKAGLIYGVARDLTEERSHAIELQQVMDAINRSAIVAMTDRTGKIIHANENFCKISGYLKQELIGKTHRLIRSGAHDASFFKQLWTTIQSGRTWEGEIQNRTKSGESYFVNTTISPIFDLSGQVERYLAIRYDVTKHNEMERMLEEAQRVAKIGSWSLDFAKNVLSCSKEMTKTLRKADAQEDLPFSYLKNLLSEADQLQLSQKLQECFKLGKDFQLRIKIFENDDPRWIDFRGEAKRDDQQIITSVHGTAQDITELVLVEEQSKNERAKSLQSAKLASLGEMSAGIAHEINNPLAIIQGSVKLLLKKHSENPAILEKAKSIEKAAERVGKIVAGLRKFSRSSGNLEKFVHPMADILKESIVLTGAKARRHNVQVEMFKSTEGFVFCDEIEIEQVLVNLINNGIDATRSLDSRWIRLSLFEELGQIVLQIEDSGTGIPVEIQKKLFQPFFTTKAVGEGTGLGLSIVKGILDEHSAQIEILNNRPHTCFELRFPKPKENSADAHKVS